MARGLAGSTCSVVYGAGKSGSTNVGDRHMGERAQRQWPHPIANKSRKKVVRSSDDGVAMCGGQLAAYSAPLLAVRRSAGHSALEALAMGLANRPPSYARPTSRVGKQRRRCSRL